MRKWLSHRTKFISQALCLCSQSDFNKAKNSLLIPHRTNEQTNFENMCFHIPHVPLFFAKSLFLATRPSSRPSPFSSPEPTILLASGRNRELWEQPFRACAIDEDWVKPDGQNSVISFVLSKWLLPELSIPAAGQKDRRLWGREWTQSQSVIFLCARRSVSRRVVFAKSI